MIDVRCTNRSCNAQFGPQYSGTNCMHCGFRVETVQILTPGQFAGQSAPQNVDLQNLLGQLAGASANQSLNLQHLSLGAPGMQPGSQNPSLVPPPHPGLQMSQPGNSQAQILQNALAQFLQNQNQNVSIQSAPGTTTLYGQPHDQGAHIKQEPGVTTLYGQPGFGAPSSTYGTGFAPTLNSVPLNTATGTFNPPVQPSQGFNPLSIDPQLLRLGDKFFAPANFAGWQPVVPGGSNKRNWTDSEKKAPKPLKLAEAKASGLPPKPLGGGSSNGANSDRSGQDPKRRKKGRKGRGAKTSKSPSKGTSKSSDGWCFHCSFPGHWDDECDHPDKEARAKIKDSYWTNFHVVNEMDGTPPAPTTYTQAMCFYHELYQHGVDITNHAYARDQVFPQVQAYMRSKLDDVGLRLWQVMTSLANRNLNFLAMDIRRRATEFYNKGIHKPLADLMEREPMGIMKSSSPNPDGTVSWTRPETTQFLNNLGDNPINAQFNQDSFDEMVRMLNRELDSYITRRDIGLDSAKHLVSNVINGPDKAGIMKSIMLPIEFMITPIRKTANFRTVKDQLPLPNAATLVQTWETVTGASSVADD